MQAPEIKTKEWKTVQLQEVVRVFRGASPRPKGDPRYYGGPIPRVLIEDVTRDGKYVTPRVDSLTEEGAKKSRYLEKGSVVLSCSGTRVAIPGILAIPACIHDGFFGFDSFKELVPEYLYYLFEQLHEKMQSSATTGGVFNNLTTQIMKEMYIEIPSLSEQKKIIALLNTWDKTIELKEKLIGQKKEQKKELMQKLLTGELRLQNFRGEWREVPLSKIVKKTKGKAVEIVSEGNFPIIDMDYLETGTYKNFTNDATVLAQKNDVLLLWDGSRAGMAFTGAEGSVGSTFVKLECKSVNNVFLQKNLEMNEKKIQKLREGSGIPHVPKDFLTYYKVKTPSLQEQEAIAKVLALQDQELLLLESEIVNLKSQKKALMQQLLTGKIRVKV